MTDLRDHNWPLFLPRSHGSDVTCWYALAPDAEHLRALSAQLLAFIGPSYSSFAGRSRKLDLDDATERSVADISRHIVVLPVPEPRTTYGSKIEERIGWLRDLRASRPPSPGADERPVAELVRDLEESLRLGDVDAAEWLVSHLEQQASLDPRNLSFLNVLVLELAERWDEILDSPRLDSVLANRRPARVTCAVLRAVQARHIDSFVMSDDPKGALARFQSVVWPRYSQLFSSRVGLTGEAVRSLFMLKACSASQADVVEELLAEADEDELWLQALAEAAVIGEVEVEEADALSDAWHWYRQGDLDRAWGLVLKETVGLERTELVVLCARDSRSIAWAHTALEEFERLAATMGGDFAPPPRLARARDDLLRELSPMVEEPPDPVAHVSGWVSWADALTQPVRWPGAISIAEAGAAEWDAADLIRTDTVAECFAVALESVSVENLSILQQSVSHVLRSLESLPSDLPGVGRVFETLTTLVLIDDAPGQTFFLTLSDVVQRLLEGRVETDAYARLLSDIRAVVEQHGSATQFTALLELLDALVVSRCPDASARVAVFSAILDRATRDQRHLQPFQISVLQGLAGDLGERIPDELVERVQANRDADDEGEFDPWSVYGGHTIALYSLNESALRHASAEIGRLVDNVDVRTYSDHGGSDALRDAARNADVFVVATRAAKHAATEFISRHLPAGSRPLFAAGKGSASLLGALFEHARSPLAEALTVPRN